MQPHGLMNTLAVLQELIEQRPANASRLVERLADQLTLLRALSQKALVPLREELELVRTQLDLIEMAREMPLPLRVDGPTDEVRLPPGVLHTLVENAITHGGVRADAPAFALHVTAGAGKRWHIELRSPRGAGREGGGGQGQRFVRESLSSAFGTAWSFESGPLDEVVWLDRFSIPQA
jgi:LytS/YehU family sensor histidine kinase